ncbi:RsmB/NOP family class I SAM-dependent RNA methyltransferase [Mangrovicoccus sp. HB161399]|uniref:RsmB/NOP family class I SAM-dependent RNA methyltransferase n=1 Tax=Mangrovicoccus sp. HB161399 TaxID=2720392 RepID=UPI001552A87E
MTPAARIAAAIEVLDRVLSGEPAEKVLTTWGRTNRYAGSKDRAAVRDHVFGALRRKRSLAALGGAETGRGLMIGAMRAAGEAPETAFTGERHAPAPLDAAEAAAGLAPAPGAEAADCPDWIWERSLAQLGPRAEPVWAVQGQAAPVGLRANLARISAAGLAERLAGQGIEVQPDPRSPSALIAPGRPRGLTQLAEWQDGLFELQDAGSQWVSDLVPLGPGQSLMDYCAGGGGKTLAVAARVKGRFHAHDAHPRRMADLPVRAERAGVNVAVCAPGGKLPSCDTVLADVPCSGSGTWRRAPDAKWRFSPADLEEVTALQAEILDRAAELVRPGGHLVHATCSVFDEENAAQAAAFLARHPEFSEVSQASILPDAGSDGYFAAVFAKAK